ncbi:MAG: hypothetical protein K2M23_01580, partial [Alphaproteobacteria bacterium]|nr:hypothetical protein [Alphaproteobacteria bacterium]
ICSHRLLGTPGRNECTVYDITYAPAGGCADTLFLGNSSIEIDKYSDRVRNLFYTGGGSATKITDTISVQNCDGPCAILYKLK